MYVLIGYKIMSFFSFLSPPIDDEPTLNIYIKYVLDPKSGYSYCCPFFDDERWSFDHLGSRKATQTSHETNAGIFSQIESIVWFWRGATSVWVDFGSTWSLDNYADPVAEIYRRIALVEEAFAAKST